ncbi:unnamed protein product [Victoria cruziana]
MIKKTSGTEIRALARHIGMSAQKARRVIDQVRGCSYEQTLMILELMPYRAYYPIFKLVYSSAANASYNRGLKEADLFISKVKTASSGHSYPIKRSTCHITIVLSERPNFNLKNI